MVTHRRIAAVVTLILVGGGGLAAASAAESAAPAQPAPVESVHHFYARGPEASYSGDSGSMSANVPFRWQAPGEGGQSAVVEVSFQYHTKGPGPFVVDVGVREADGEKVKVRPAELTLAPSPTGSSTTVRFLVPGLRGGQNYETSVGVNTSSPPSGVNRIGTRKVLLTVESSG